MSTTKLYKTKDGQFGTWLTKDSQGNAVIELKGSGQVIAIPPADLEEVRPYTVQIETLNGSAHYEVDPNAGLAVDDIILFPKPNPILGTVRAVDTKGQAGKTLNHAFRLTPAALEPVKAA